MTTIFVFGSNLSGRHGAGAALTAWKNHGAIYGRGKGRMGNSYGIATKDHELRTMSLDRIREQVRSFLVYAGNHPELEFEVTRVGCGLAGYTDEQIAPMFKGAPDNCKMPEGWR